MEEKKTITLGTLVKVIGGILVLVFLIIAIKNMLSSSKENIIDNNVILNQGDVQVVNLGFKNGNYYPNTVIVKANQPVEISLDKSVVGCYRSFTLRQMGIAKYLATPSDSVSFTPTQAGTYRFAGSMGMGTGTLVVE